MEQEGLFSSSQGKADTWSPRGLECILSANLPESPNIRYGLGPHPELSLSTNGTQPYEEGPVRFTPSTNRIHPYAC